MDFRSIFQTWVKVLSSPGEETFVAERDKSSATLATALVWMLLAAVISALLGLLKAQMFTSAMGGLGQITALLPPELQGEFVPIAEAGTTGGTFASLSLIIVGPIGFLISVGVYHVIASILGGRGQFGSYAYLLATFGAPLMIVNSLIALVPLVGSCVGAFLPIYYLVLTYFATKAEYGLSKGRAIVTVLLPVLALVLLAICLVVVAGVAISSLFTQ